MRYLGQRQRTELQSSTQHKHQHSCISPSPESHRDDVTQMDVIHAVSLQWAWEVHHFTASSKLTCSLSWRVVLLHYSLQTQPWYMAWSRSNQEPSILDVFSRTCRNLRVSCRIHQKFSIEVYTLPLYLVFQSILQPTLLVDKGKYSD